MYPSQLNIQNAIDLIIILGGGGQRARRLNILIAIVIWIIAILCGIPALVGSYVKVHSKSLFLFILFYFTSNDNMR